MPASGGQGAPVDIGAIIQSPADILMIGAQDYENRIKRAVGRLLGPATVDDYTAQDLVDAVRDDPERAAEIVECAVCAASIMRGLRLLHEIGGAINES